MFLSTRRQSCTRVVRLCVLAWLCTWFWVKTHLCFWGSCGKGTKCSSRPFGCLYKRALLHAVCSVGQAAFSENSTNMLQPKQKDPIWKTFLPGLSLDFAYANGGSGLLGSDWVMQMRACEAFSCDLWTAGWLGFHMWLFRSKKCQALICEICVPSVRMV